MEVSLCRILVLTDDRARMTLFLSFFSFSSSSYSLILYAYAYAAAAAVTAADIHGRSLDIRELSSRRKFISYRKRVNVHAHTTHSEKCEWLLHLNRQNGKQSSEKKAHIIYILYARAQVLTDWFKSKVVHTSIKSASMLDSNAMQCNWMPENAKLGWLKSTIHVNEFTVVAVVVAVAAVTSIQHSYPRCEQLFK